MFSDTIKQNKLHTSLFVYIGKEKNFFFKFNHAFQMF